MTTLFPNDQFNFINLDLDNLPKTPPLKDINDLIKISEEKKLYGNIDCLMLWKIESSLKKIMLLVGLTEIKQSIFSQIIYFLQYFHLTKKNDMYKSLIRKKLSDKDNNINFYEFFQNQLNNPLIYPPTPPLQPVPSLLSTISPISTIPSAVPDGNEDNLPKIKIIRLQPKTKDVVPKRKMTNASTISHKKRKYTPKQIKKINVIIYPSNTRNNAMIIPYTLDYVVSSSVFFSNSNFFDIFNDNSLYDHTDNGCISDFINTIFMGHAGTGKTTISLILADIYKDMDLLKSHNKNKPVLAHRSDLVGGYLGQTSLKTKKFLEDNLGNVVVIDEAYSLGNISKSSGDSYSFEAVDTLMAFISEHKNDIGLIICGYKEQLYNRFFTTNEGLKRRFPFVYEIKEYSKNDLTKILTTSLTKDEWIFDNKLEQIEELLSNYKFRNAAGDIMNLCSRIKIIHSNRCCNDPNTLKRTVNKDDIKNALEDLFKQDKEDEEKDKAIVNSMYM